MSEVLVRLARPDDLPTINAIYNYYVLNSTCTYQLDPETEEARRAWYGARTESHPVTVAEVGGEVVGWGSLSPFKERAGYRHSVEASIYIRHDMHRRGIGRVLLLDLIDRARRAGHHTILGGASADQAPSLALQESLGFREVARFREVGYKFGRWLDVVYLQLML